MEPLTCFKESRKIFPKLHDSLSILVEGGLEWCFEEGILLGKGHFLVFERIWEFRFEERRRGVAKWSQKSEKRTYIREFSLQQEVSHYSEWWKLRHPRVFSLQQESFRYNEVNLGFQFLGFSLQRRIFSLQWLGSILPMSNACTTVKKNLAATTTLYLLIFWFFRYSAKFSHYSGCPRFAPKIFKLVLFLFFLLFFYFYFFLVGRTLL